MKSTATRQPTPPAFQPVVLTITIETQAELNALGALFNSGLIADVHHKMDFDQKIWQTLQTEGADLDPCEFDALLKAKVLRELK